MAEERCPVEEEIRAWIILRNIPTFCWKFFYLISSFGQLQKLDVNAQLDFDRLLDRLFVQCKSFASILAHR